MEIKISFNYLAKPELVDPSTGADKTTELL